MPSSLEIHARSDGMHSRACLSVNPCCCYFLQNKQFPHLNISINCSPAKRELKIQVFDFPEKLLLGGRRPALQRGQRHSPLVCQNCHVPPERMLSRMETGSGHQLELRTLLRLPDEAVCCVSIGCRTAAPRRVVPRKRPPARRAGLRRQ